ncbi:hypothetical protein LPB41_05680 [Thalassospira sp. MA62]|nr:hypothetical protein [Thalassospira sp. MA62]
MSIGADWRQFSPGDMTGSVSTGAPNKGAQPNGADQLSETTESRSFSEYMFGKDGFEFTDLLDVINPLQHIPGVGMIYRELTGDEIGNGARVVGGGLFGGIIGLAGAAIDAVVDATTGEDTGSHVMAFLEDSFEGTPDTGTAVASASSDPAANAHQAGGTVASNGGYQGDLVLPWMTQAQGTGAATPSMAASSDEQQTIIGSAPQTPVDQTVLADAGMAAQQTANGATTVNASDLNVPWGAGAAQQAQQAGAANVVAQNDASPQNLPPRQAGQDGLTAQSPTAQSLASLQQSQNDMTEMAVAMASAGQVNPAANLHRTIASNSAAEPVAQPASFNSNSGDTVWARAANSGRVSRMGGGFGLSPEIAAHEARAKNLAQAQMQAQKQGDEASSGGEHVASAGAERQQRPATRQNGAQAAFDQVKSNYAGGDAPLSAAEMAARFNAALGRDNAQVMAAEAQSSANRGDQEGAASRRPASDNRDRNDAAQNAGLPENHPLMEQANSHMGNDAPVGAWFSQTMMDGLKKYQAMQQGNKTPGSAI